MNKLSDDLIMLTSKLMLVKEKSEILKLTNDLNDCIARLLEAERRVGNSSHSEKTVTGFLKFTKEEISKMPKTFRKEFIASGAVAHIIKRPSGKNTFCYEIRYRRNGYNITASSTMLETAKKKFMEKLQDAVHEKEEREYIIAPLDFIEFSLFYLNNIRSRKVKTLTLRSDLSRFNNHIKPYFSGYTVKEITPFQCQKLIDKLDNNGMGKTKDEIFSLLNCIFKTAIAHHLIKYNPMDTVINIQHDRKNGTILTNEEINRLLTEFKGTKFEKVFALALFTGLRANELFTVSFDDKFVYAKNSKRKTNAIEIKKIPIIDELKPYLPIDPSTFFSQQYISDTFARAFPNHSIKDLRATFYTKCVECKVDEIAIKLFVGHTLGMLRQAYAHPSDEYLLQEAKKIRFVPQNVPQSVPKS